LNAPFVVSQRLDLARVGLGGLALTRRGGIHLKGGTHRRVCLEEVTLRLVRRIEHGVSLKPRERRLHRLEALLHRLALHEGDLAVVDALLVEVLEEERAARRAAVDVVAVRLGAASSTSRPSASTRSTNWSAPAYLPPR
jgi:hypothetical protein